MRFLIILLLFGCVEKEIVLDKVDVKLKINGIGLTSKSFARTIDDWNHLLSPGDAEIHLDNITLGANQIYYYPYNSLDTATFGMWANQEYTVRIYQSGTSSQYLTFWAVSDTFLIETTTTELVLNASTPQCIVLIDSDYSCDIPRLTSGGANTEFYLNDGFYYLYLNAIPDTEQYKFEFCSTQKGNGVLTLPGAKRETIYYIDMIGDGSIRLNLGLDTLFNEVIIR